MYYKSTKKYQVVFHILSNKRYAKSKNKNRLKLNDFTFDLYDF